MQQIANKSFSCNFNIIVKLNVFFLGLDLLSRANSTKLMDAIEKAREQSVAIVRMAQNILDSKQVTDVLLSVML